MNLAADFFVEGLFVKREQRPRSVRRTCERL